MILCRAKYGSYAQRTLAAIYGRSGLLWRPRAVRGHIDAGRCCPNTNGTNRYARCGRYAGELSAAAAASNDGYDGSRLSHPSSAATDEWAHFGSVIS